MRLINNKAGIACIIGFSMLASSCSDWLDPKPLSFYTPENSFINYNGLKTGTDMLNRDVRYFDFYPTAGSADPCILSEYFFSDMSVNGRTDAANSPQDLIRQITPSASLTGNASQINNFWTYLYKGIKDANTLLTRSKTAKFDNEQQRLEIEGLACFQHFGAVLEVLQADLGALGVQQGSDRLAQLFTDGLQLFKAAQMLFVRAVGKIKTGNIHAVGDQLAQNAFLIGGRAQSADDLCFSHILLLPPTTTSHSLFCGRLSTVIQTAARGQREKSRAVVQKRKNPVVQNFSTYYYIR